MKSRLLDASIGIGSLIGSSVVDNQPTMPKPSIVGVNTQSITSMEATYAPQNMQSILESAVCPETGDGSLLAPSAFAYNLKLCKNGLLKSPDTSVHEFLEKDLKPLLENSSLLNMYVSLMIEG